MNVDMQTLSKMLANGIQQHGRIGSHSQPWGYSRESSPVLNSKINMDYMQQAEKESHDPIPPCRKCSKIQHSFTIFKTHGKNRNREELLQLEKENFQKKKPHSNMLLVIFK